jgi:hypothetical protein
MAFILPHTLGCDAPHCPNEITVSARSKRHACEVARSKGWDTKFQMAGSSDSLVGDEYVMYCPEHEGYQPMIRR